MALVIAPSYTRRALVTPADMVDNLRLCRFLQNTGTAGSFIVRQNWGNVSAGNPNPFGNYVGSYPAVERIILSGGVGGAFDNQPANAAVTVVSDDAGDTSVDITIYGTTFGTNTVVAEVLATDGADGTSATTSVKTDWGLILGIEKAATTGTITVAEATGGLAITTVGPAATSAGVTTASPAGLDDSIPIVYASGASTKQLGIVGTDTSGTALYESVPLNGATAVTLTNTFRTVTKLLVGDVEGSVTSYAKIGNFVLYYLTQGETIELGRATVGVNATSLGSGVVLYGMW